MEEDNWWLHLYVMMSRAARLDDLLLLRAPDVEFLKHGPPKDFRARLAQFDRRVRSCKTKAEQLVKELKLERFLHDGHTRLGRRAL